MNPSIHKSPKFSTPSSFTLPQVTFATPHRNTTKTLTTPRSSNCSYPKVSSSPLILKSADCVKNNTLETFFEKIKSLLSTIDTLSKDGCLLPDQACFAEKIVEFILNCQLFSIALKAGHRQEESLDFQQQIESLQKEFNSYLSKHPSLLLPIQSLLQELRNTLPAKPSTYCLTSQCISFI